MGIARGSCHFISEVHKRVCQPQSLRKKRLVLHEILGLAKGIDVDFVLTDKVIRSLMDEPGNFMRLSCVENKSRRDRLQFEMLLDKDTVDISIIDNSDPVYFGHKSFATELGKILGVDHPEGKEWLEVSIQMARMGKSMSGARIPTCDIKRSAVDQSLIFSCINWTESFKMIFIDKKGLTASYKPLIEGIFFMNSIRVKEDLPRSTAVKDKYVIRFETTQNREGAMLTFGDCKINNLNMITNTR